MKRGWAITLGLLLVIAVASFAAVRALKQTQSRPPSAPPDLAPLQNYLALSADQRWQLAAIDARFASTRVQLRKRVLAARDELLAVLHDPNATAADGIAAARKFSAAQEALQLNTIQYVFELRGHLTPPQKAKLAGVMGRGMCGFVCGPGTGPGFRGRGRDGCGLGLGMGWGRGAGRAGQ